MATVDKYARTVSDDHIGSVRGRTINQYSFDVSIDPVSKFDGNATEYLITVNGRVVKRMNEYQAERMGLVR